MGIYADIATEMNRGFKLDELEVTRKGRNYFPQSLRLSESQKRKRVFKGIVGCRPADEMEVIRRRIARDRRERNRR